MNRFDELRELSGKLKTLAECIDDDVNTSTDTAGEGLISEEESSHIAEELAILTSRAYTIRNLLWELTEWSEEE